MLAPGAARYRELPIVFSQRVASCSQSPLISRIGVKKNGVPNKALKGIVEYQKFYRERVMSIDPVNRGPGGLSKIYRAQKTPDSNFYDTFKTTYQTLSATPDQANNPVTDTVKLSQGLQKLMGETYTVMADRRGIAEADRFAYAGILNKAYSSRGMEYPQAFLQSLSPAELAIIQREKSLAEPIQPTQLSKEGASNLLLPTGYTLDLNHDGYEEIGLALTSGFPPRDAPIEFQQAWAETIDSMDEGDVMTYSVMMHVAVVGIRVDTTLSQAPLHATDKLQSYTEVLASLLANLPAQLPYIGLAQMQKDQEFYTRLQQALLRQG